MSSYQDSKGNAIHLNSAVMFRGRIYTIKGFGEKTTLGYEIFFNQDQHVAEQATESSVDLVGPTGKFPEGKSLPEDEGEIRLAIGADKQKNLVRIEFGAPIQLLEFSPGQAEAFSTMISDAAQRVKAVQE